MKTDQIIFDNFVKDLGGIYLPSNDIPNDIVLSTFLEIGNKYINEMRSIKPNLPEVKIHYVNNNSVNACAFYTESKYFIAINIGTVNSLKQMYDNIFAMNELYGNGLFDIAKRSNYSPLFMYFAMMFLIIHEYSHIRFGHCRLINHLWGNAVLNEFTSDCLINDGIFRQTLEYDADCCTIANIINRILINNIDDLTSISVQIAQCMLSCYILFKLLDNGAHSKYENYDLDELAQSTHPRSGIRQGYLLSTMFTLLQRHFSDSQIDIVADKVMEYIRKFELILNGDVNLRNLEIGIGFTQKGNEHKLKIANNWEKVRKMLEPFTHDELAPFEKISYKPNTID
jgi:hypothetical protein